MYTNSQQNVNSETEARRSWYQAQIARWVEQRRLEDALSAEEIGAMDGLQRIIAQKHSLIDNMAHLYRKYPQADIAPGLLTLITFLSDNNTGCATLSMKRMGEVFSRTERSIRDALARLKRDELIFSEKPRGGLNSHWPVINRSLVDPQASVMWYVNARSPSYADRKATEDEKEHRKPASGVSSEEHRKPDAQTPEGAFRGHRKPDAGDTGSRTHPYITKENITNSTSLNGTSGGKRAREAGKQEQAEEPAYRKPRQMGGLFKDDPFYQDKTPKHAWFTRSATGFKLHVSHELRAELLKIADGDERGLEDALTIAARWCNKDAGHMTLATEVAASVTKEFAGKRERDERYAKGAAARQASPRSSRYGTPGEAADSLSETLEAMQQSQKLREMQQ